MEITPKVSKYWYDPRMKGQGQISLNLNLPEPPPPFIFDERDNDV